MKHCPNPECPGLAKFNIVSEYEDVALNCSDCGTPLKAGAAPTVEQLVEDNRPKAPDPDMKLALAGSLVREPEIVMAESILEEAGIPFFTQGETIQDLFGVGRLVMVNPLIKPVRFFVPEDLLEEAQEILAAIQAPGDEESSESDSEERGE
jgi:hypothetical protein